MRHIYFEPRRVASYKKTTESRQAGKVGIQELYESFSSLPDNARLQVEGRYRVGLRGFLLGAWVLIVP